MASRQKLQQEVDAFKAGPKGEVIRLQGKNLTLTGLVQICESGGFFQDRKLLVIEKVFSLKTSQKDKVFAYLKNTQVPVICWEDKKVSSRSITALHAKNLIFQTPSVIFQLLDSIFPGNNRVSLKLLESVLKSSPAELVFFMLAKHIKALITTSDQKAAVQSGLPPWRVAKLSAQAKMFKNDGLVKIYRQLMDIEASIKQGRAILDLTSQLEQFIISI